MNGDTDYICIYLKGFARPKCFFLNFLKRFIGFLLSLGCAKDKSANLD